VNLLSGLVHFRFVAHPLQPEVVEPFSSTDCMVPQSFAARENRSYPEFWAVTGDSWYPGYFTLIVAPEPSVEQVARVGHLTVGRTCSRMVLWALL
jgi:hypothetical protein